MAAILIIDHEPVARQSLRELLGRNHQVEVAGSWAQGLARARQGQFDLVMMEASLPDGDGMELLPLLRGLPSRPEVIVFTDGVLEAKQAYAHSAWAYLAKPLERQEVLQVVQRALDYRRRKFRTDSPPFNREGIVGRSPQLEACLELVARAAQSHASVLITGETGTGKELVARAIHNNSLRRGGNFVVVDCTALPPTLAESIILGHERGAFTGAHRRHRGLVAQAHGGTLFLDEVGELPLGVQKTLLRVLQEHRYRPVGGEREMTSDFRLVAATNRDLDQMAAKGRFRQDLLFRLRSLTIHLPPLRERREDIPLLLSYFLDRRCQEYGLTHKSFSPELLRFLETYPWPGNVRELVGVVEALLAAAGGEPTLYPKHLPPHLRVEAVSMPLYTSRPRLISSPTLPTFQEYRRRAILRAEREYLEMLLKVAGQDRAAALRISGLSQSRLYALLKKHRLPRFGRR
jgi:two-component system NtrC family response regulator